MKNRFLVLLLLVVLSISLVACTDPFAKDLPGESVEDAVDLTQGVSQGAVQGDSKEETMTITGRLVVGKNSYLIVDEDLSPISMSVDGSADAFFNGISTGDKIEVVSGLVAETYPASTHVYSVKVLEKGTDDDIPFSVISQLRDLGWIE